MDIVLLGVAIVIAALGFGCLYWRRAMDTEVALMAATQTSRAADISRIAPGTLVEVKGAIRSDAPISGQFTQRACVHVRSLIERKEMRYNDKQQRQTHYIPENDRTETITFEVEDPSGRVRVDPKGARIEPRDVFSEMRASGADDIVTLAGNLAGGGEAMTHRYREWMLPLGEAVYVLGTVQPDGSIGAAPPNAAVRHFLVTCESEEQRTKSSRMWSQVLLGVSALLLIGALVAFYKSIG